MMRSYRMLADSTVHPEIKKGAIVYDCKGWDYGSANDDTRWLGYEHKSVTLLSDGDYPFFTVPVRDLEQIAITVAAESAS